MKHCVGCDTNKKNDQFYASKKSVDGLNRYCVTCCKVNRGTEQVRKRDKRVKLSRRQIQRCMQLRAGGQILRIDATVTLAKIFKRDRGICHVCLKWVAPGKASMDHVPALSKKGNHTFEGILLTHLKCNLRMGNRH